MSKNIKSLVSIVLVTLMLMPVFVGTASAEQESGSIYYIDLGEMNSRGEGYYLSFALPAGYEVTNKAVEYVEYGIKGGVCEIYPGHTMIKIVGSSDAINHIYSPKKREWGTYVQGPYSVVVHVYFYSRVCECDGTIEDYDEAIGVFSCGTLTYNETIEVSCGNLARYHGPIKYTRIHGHDACYWENPGEDIYMMYAHIFLEESHIGWDFLGGGGLREPDYVTVDGQLLREKDRQVGNDLFSSIQISGPPPAEEESTYLCARPVDIIFLENFFNHAYIDDKHRAKKYALFKEGGSFLNGYARKTDNSPDPKGYKPVCKPCLPKNGQTQADLSKCLEAKYNNYPDPSKYSAIFGPNCNTFAATLAKCCGDSSRSGLGWVLEWNHAPAEKWEGPTLPPSSTLPPKPTLPPPP